MVRTGDKRRKYSADTVREIRQRFADGWTQAEIARVYHMPPNTVNGIVHGRSWPDLDAGN